MKKWILLLGMLLIVAPAFAQDFVDNDRLYGVGAGGMQVDQFNQTWTDHKAQLEAELPVLPPLAEDEIAVGGPSGVPQAEALESITPASKDFDVAVDGFSINDSIPRIAEMDTNEDFAYKFPNVSFGSPITLTEAPYSDVPCVVNGYFDNTFYLCVDGYHTQSVTTTLYNNTGGTSGPLVSQLVSDGTVDCSSYNIAQTFTLDAGTSQPTLTIKYYLTAAPDTLTFRLASVATYSTAPDFTTYIDEQVVTDSVIGWNSVTFSSGALSAGAYAYGVQESGTASCTMDRSQTDVYAEGTYFYSSGASSSWLIDLTSPREYTFEVYQP